MKQISNSITGLTTLLALSLSVSAANAEALESASVLLFGPENTLFVGDGMAGSIHAYATQTVENPMAQAGFNLRDLDREIATLVGVNSDDVMIKDLAIHPESKEAYIAVSYNAGDSYSPAVVIANQSGQLRLMDTASPQSSLAIDNTIEDDFAFYDRVDVRSLTFTDLDFHMGKLYISGLSNADFAASLWTASYPFDGTTSTTSVEIYHTTHDLQETRAPIRTMMISQIDGVDMVLAAYTCTPLVAFPLSDLTDGAHVSGKSIAELGFGNTPIDMIAFDATDFQTQEQYPIMLMTNKNQSAQVVPMTSIVDAVASEAISQPVAFGVIAGVETNNIPLTGILQADEQNAYMITTIRRDAEEGDLELVSYMKNVYLRLGDFESEFEFPDFKYPEEAKWMYDMQQGLKAAEGEAVQNWEDVSGS